MERFKTLEWVEPLKTVKTILIGGIGGIGSFAALWASRLDINLILYDNDTIDHTNMSGQHYYYSNIGKSKAEALDSQIMDFSNPKLSVEIYGLYDKDSLIEPIMFSAFDNMQARRTMFNNWRSQKDRRVFIDGRMLAEYFEVYTVTPENEDRYESEYLFADSEAKAVLCSAKATTHCGAIVAGFMIAAFTNFLTNEAFKRNIRETPLKLSYELEIFKQNIIL